VSASSGENDSREAAVISKGGVAQEAVEEVGNGWLLLREEVGAYEPR
jgi:hypothetical protein